MAEERARVLQVFKVALASLKRRDNGGIGIEPEHLDAGPASRCQMRTHACAVSILRSPAAFGTHLEPGPMKGGGKRQTDISHAHDTYDCAFGGDALQKRGQVRAHSPNFALPQNHEPPSTAREQCRVRPGAA